MRTSLLLISFILLILSCKNEKDFLLDQYQAIYGTWETQFISYDSSGVHVKITTPYNKLVINNNLGYEIYLDFDKLIESGTIKIMEQSHNRLELYFAAKYPIYSSYAGSHIFGFSNAVLLFLSSDSLVFKTENDPFHQNPEYHFSK